MQQSLFYLLPHPQLQLQLQFGLLVEAGTKFASFAKLTLLQGLVLLIVIGLSIILQFPTFWFSNILIKRQIHAVNIAVTYAKIEYNMAYTKKLALKKAKVITK